MSENTQQKPAQANSPKQSAPATRVVHVTVPAKVFNHGKAQAYLSEVSWAYFIEHLIANSQPINSTQST